MALSVVRAELGFLRSAMSRSGPPSRRPYVTPSVMSNLPAALVADESCGCGYAPCDEQERRDSSTGSKAHEDSTGTSDVVDVRHCDSGAGAGKRAEPFAGRRAEIGDAPGAEIAVWSAEVVNPRKVRRQLVRHEDGPGEHGRSRARQDGHREGDA